MSKILLKLLDIFAVALVLHAIWFAFTGNSLIKPLGPNDADRFFLILATHITTLFIVTARRLP